MRALLRTAPALSKHRGLLARSLSAVEPLPSTVRLAQDVVDGKRSALSRAITLVESWREDHAKQAEMMLDLVAQGRKSKAEAAKAAGQGDATPRKLETFRLGIAGPPGAGKSTFIEALGMHLASLGRRVAVLAIDPSSSRTGGSILGDKTRMAELSRCPSAFVRPSPTRGVLGGIAQHTSDVVLLCEAAGFEIVIVETVGLGQSEVVVDDAVDMLMLLLPPAGGDELQGVKRGIMELADMVVINKADGDLLSSARQSAAEHRRALQLMRRRYPDWVPPVVKCSALRQERIDEAWKQIEKFWEFGERSSALLTKRIMQSKKWMWAQLEEELLRMARKDAHVKQRSQSLEQGLAVGHVTARRAGRDLLDTFVSHLSSSKS